MEYETVLTTLVTLASALLTKSAALAAKHRFIDAPLEEVKSSEQYWKDECKGLRENFYRVRERLDTAEEKVLQLRRHISLAAEEKKEGTSTSAPEIGHIVVKKPSKSNKL